MITLSKPVGDSFEKGGELTAASHENESPLLCSPNEGSTIWSFVIILQSYKRIQEYRISLWSSCKVVTKIIASKKTNNSKKTHNIPETNTSLKTQPIPETPTKTSTHHKLLLSFVIILQSCYKKSSMPENQHIASHVATIFCNHLAKLLQKIIASLKTNTSHVATIFCKYLAKL